TWCRPWIGRGLTSSRATGPRRPSACAGTAPPNSFHHRELARESGLPRRLHAVHVEPRRHVEVVLRAQVPGHEAVERAVLAQRLHEIAVHVVDAHYRAVSEAAEFDAALAATLDVERCRLE